MHPLELSVIAELLKPSDAVLEFGSGGSTYWLAERVSEVHSIEHHQMWASKVIRDAPANVTIHWRRPAWPLKEATRAEPGQFESYLSVPLNLARVWDAVLIDGRARIDSAVAVAPFLKVGGWLFFHDYFQRRRYTSRIDELEPFYEFCDQHSVRETTQTLAVFQRRSRALADP
jgi:hypothetical protein